MIKWDYEVEEMADGRFRLRPILYFLGLQIKWIGFVDLGSPYHTWPTTISYYYEHCIGSYEQVNQVRLGLVERNEWVWDQPATEPVEESADWFDRPIDAVIAGNHVKLKLHSVESNGVEKGDMFVNCVFRVLP